MRKITKIENQGIGPVKRKRVAAYARVSNGKDAMLHSLSAQISYYNNYISSRGDWKLAGIYADEAMTGTKENRPEFQRMLADCRAGRIDMVITKSLTRFARNTVTLLSAVRELKALEVDIYFEKENIHTLSTDGELMLTLLASFAQEESRSASENQKWRIRKQYEQGLATNGRVLGYRYEKGSFYIIPEEAEIVRQIFRDFLSGMGINAIVKKLNRAGIPSRKGSPWTMHGVRYILHNEKYTGDLLLQKRYRLDHITKKIMENHGERPQYFVKNSHEPIISREDFEEVQKELERRMKKFGITREPPKTNLFTGLIRCGLCGKKFRHKMSNAVHPCRKAVWCCGTFNVYGKDACPAQQIPEDILITKTAQIIGLEGFSREMLLAHVKEILVPGHNRLVYILHDGRTEEVSWQHKSRRESWTPEMRQKARERELERIRQKKEEDK